MNKQNRRSFLKTVGLGAAATTAAAYAPFAIGGSSKKVVIVGGGMGGAVAAKYIRMMDKSIDVTLIESNKDYFTGFTSNLVVSGQRSLDEIKFGYDGLRGHGINVVIDKATNIDANAKSVKTAGGKTFNYDRCIVAPGIDFRYDRIDGYNEDVANTKITHAWKAGPQTVMLRDQVQSMKKGGTVIISAPPNPFRCSPGPYERVSQIAGYFKKHNPTAKILVLDDKEKFSKFGLFIGGWKKHYGYGTDNSMIEWVKGSAGGKIESVDVAGMTLSGEVDDYKGDVINIIPAQKAGNIAHVAGLTNASGWCPIEGKTFESTIHKNIHVIGDAAIQSPLPKSGYAANSEGKVCAAAIVAMLNGDKVPDPSYVNTCYSVIAPGDGISVAMVYAYKGGKIVKVKGSGGLTSGKFNAKLRGREEQYGYSWFDNITQDTFG
ncbi:Sulfide dehydrogenase [flavocytochrome C] flavoprotein chain precursor [uncultured Candidatus Thioglobus sp.]|nr:Sulfide dehydrogenase [flavocytochrome C] flavoprotein chain precursor [uncultured Candidatus Thioglobus sp.]